MAVGGCHTGSRHWLMAPATVSKTGGCSAARRKDICLKSDDTTTKVPFRAAVAVEWPATCYHILPGLSLVHMLLIILGLTGCIA